MKLFLEGDKSKHHCGKVVSTTFMRRDVPFSDGKGSATNILAGVCDGCGQTVSIPAQSTPAIREARRKDLKSIEAQLPSIYVDALDLAAYIIDNRASTDFRRVLLTYFLHRYAGDAQAAIKLRRAHQKARDRYPETRGSSRRRLSMKVSSTISDELRALAQKAELNTTEILKSVVFGIQTDVLESPKPALLKELRALAMVSA